MLINSFFAFIATLCFGVLSNIRGKNLFFASLGGSLCWFVFLYTTNSFHNSSLLCFFIASVFTAAYSEVMARVLKAPVTTFVISGIIPLVPGSGMYETMLKAVQGTLTESLSIGLNTLFIAGTIAVSVFFVTSSARVIVLLMGKLKKISL